MPKNSNLHAAKTAKNDEFYTRMQDIERECCNYKEHFKGKIIYCNCDDPRESNFFKYFSLNFEFFELKALIATSYNAGCHGNMLIYYGDKNGNKRPDDEEVEVVELHGDGDFRSEECISLLRQADIVVTNPPFSLFREYVAQLMEYGKKFLIIGSQNAITCKEIFPLVKENNLWLGMNFVKEFVQPDGTIKKFGNICWYTNITHKKRNMPLDLYKKYSAEEFPKYDNYDAIEVSKVKDIPEDYDGVMGVPITFLDKYNPEQFKIIGLDRYTCPKEVLVGGRVAINGKPTYARILIRHKK